MTEYGLLAAMGLGGALFCARPMILIPAVVPNVGIPLALDFESIIGCCCSRQSLA